MSFTDWVTRWQDMKCHIKIFVEDNYKDMSLSTTAFYPSDQALSHMDQEWVTHIVNANLSLYINVTIS